MWHQVIMISQPHNLTSKCQHNQQIQRDNGTTDEVNPESWTQLKGSK